MLKAIVIIIAGLLVVLGFCFWRRLLAKFRGKRDDDYPVRYTNYKLPENKKKNE